MIFYASPRLTKTRASQKLETFSTLPPGWHYGRGGPIAEAVIAQAERVARQLVMGGISRTDAFPGVDGDVRVTGYLGDHFIAVDVSAAADRFDVTHEINGAECCSAPGVDWATAREAIKRVAEEIWGISAFSIQNTGTAHAGVSMRSPSRSHATGDYRLLKPSALATQAA